MPSRRPAFGDLVTSVNDFLEGPTSNFRAINRSAGQTPNVVSAKFKAGNGTRVELGQYFPEGSAIPMFRGSLTKKFSTVEVKKTVGDGELTVDVSTKKLAKRSLVRATGIFDYASTNFKGVEAKAEYGPLYGSGAFQFDAQLKSIEKTLDAGCSYTEKPYAIGVSSQFSVASGALPALKSYDVALAFAENGVSVVTTLVNRKEVEVAAHCVASPSVDCYMLATVDKSNDGAMRAKAKVGAAYKIDASTTVQVAADQSKSKIAELVLAKTITPEPRWTLGLPVEVALAVSAAAPLTNLASPTFDLVKCAITVLN